VACAAPVVAAQWQPAQAEARTKGRTSCKKLPVIPRSEVEQHKTADSGIWVTYGDGVYDVTEFIAAHPGGDRILLAAGGAVEPYWAMYAQHKQKTV
jgi:sulfite oxidase